MINCAHDPRVGLQLTRYHSWPRLHDQSVGEHSCQIMRILLTVWPDAPRSLLVHAVTHDMGEMAGDVQYPFKKNDPVLKERMDAAEQSVLAEMAGTIGVPPHVNLGEFGCRVFKICEFIEMWEYGLHELNLGNKYGGIVAQRCIDMARRMLSEIVGNPNLVSSFKNYINRRLAWENQ